MLVRAFGGEMGIPEDWVKKADWVKKNVGSIGRDWSEDSSEDACHADAVFSTVRRRMTTKNFRGGKIAAVFGEVDVDLTGAEIAGEQAVIHADAVFGAHKIRVPETWQVVVRGTAVFGEFSDKTYQRPSPETGAKRLVVKGAAVFGSVIVRN